MTDLNTLIGIGLIVVAVLGSLVLGYALGYTARGRHWR